MGEYVVFICVCFCKGRIVVLCFVIGICIVWVDVVLVIIQWIVDVDVVWGIYVVLGRFCIDNESVVYRCRYRMGICIVWGRCCSGSN